MVDSITKTNDVCKYHESAKAFDDFLINSLSQVYIPITKAELWDDDESNMHRRIEIYTILSEILKTLDILIQPLCPFTSEYLYQTAFAQKKSILLERWPVKQNELINDGLEESFDLMREAVSISAAARMKAKLKRRWPLNEAIICVKKGQKEKIDSLDVLLKSQLNIESTKTVEIENSDGLEQFLEIRSKGVPVKPIIELERKAIGPKAKQDMGNLLQLFSQTSPENIISDLEQKGNYTFSIEGRDIVLDKEDFIVNFDVNEGFAFSQRNDMIVIISTQRNQEMMAKGLIKDLARRLQTLRKERGYNPTDVLEIASITELDNDSIKMIKDKVEEIAFLVRVKKVSFDKICKEYKEDDIDGQKIKISVE